MILKIQKEFRLSLGVISKLDGVYSKEGKRVRFQLPPYDRRGLFPGNRRQAQLPCLRQISRRGKESPRQQDNQYFRL